MDTNLIQSILDIFEQSTVNEMNVEGKDIKIHLKKQNQTVIQPTEVLPEKKIEDSAYMKAPFVGTYYSAPSENSAPFVEVGKAVKKGDTLCIIEAMKVMNEIKADKDGVIKDIKAVNGKMVEYNEPLILIGD